MHRYLVIVCMCLGIQVTVNAGDQRPASAPLVPTQTPTTITPRAASDSAVSKKIEYQDLRDASAIIWGIHDLEYAPGEPEGSEDGGGTLFLPETAYKTTMDIFADIVAEQAAVQKPDAVASSKVSLPRPYSHRSDTGETTYFVQAKPHESSPTKKRVEENLAAYRERLAGYRAKKTPSPSSRVSAEDFHETGAIEEGFSPVQLEPENTTQFAMDDV